MNFLKNESENEFCGREKETKMSVENNECRLCVKAYKVTEAKFNIKTSRENILERLNKLELFLSPQKSSTICRSCLRTISRFEQCLLQKDLWLQNIINSEGAVGAATRGKRYLTPEKIPANKRRKTNEEEIVTNGSEEMEVSFIAILLYYTPTHHLHPR